MAARVEGCSAIVNETDFDLQSRAWALVLRATAHRDAGDEAAAVGDLSHAIRIQPNLSTAYRIRGAALQALQLPDKALADLDEAVELAPIDPYNYLTRALYFRETGDLDRSRADFERGLRLDPGIVDLYFERGRLDILAGDSEQAVLDFHKALELDPASNAARYNLATAYNKLEQWDDALQAIEGLIADQPNDAGAHHLRALIELGKGDKKAALASIEKAAALDPKDLGIVFDRGWIHSRAGEWLAAVADYTAAVPAYSGSAVLFVDRGHALFMAGREEAALEDAERALAMDGQYRDAHWLKSVSLLYLGRYDDALAAAQAGLKAKADDADLLIMSARIRLAQGHNVAALLDLGKALQITPDSLEARTYGAVAVRAMGMTGTARMLLDGVLAKRPDYTVALEQKAFLLDDAGERTHALYIYQKLITAVPDEPSYRWRAATIEAGLGDFPSAVLDFWHASLRFGDAAPAPFLTEYAAALVAARQWEPAIVVLHRALRLEPRNAWAFDELGFAEAEVGRLEKAVTHLGRALRLYPDGDPGADRVRFRRAVALANLKHFEEALDDFNLLVAEFPLNDEALVGRGTVLLEVGRASEAMADAEVRLAADPSSVNALLLKSAVEERTGRLDAAIATLDRAAAAAADNARVYFVRARLHDKSGDLKAALADFDRALVMEPDNANYLNERADVLLRLGWLDEARWAAERAVEVEADYAIAWVTLGQVLLESDNAGEAVKDFDRAIALGCDCSAAYYYRAVANFRLGRTGPARQDLAVASEHDDGSFAKLIESLRSQLS